MMAIAAACASNLRGFAAEFHPWNRRARTVIEKMRVTGLVVLATSIVGLAATVPLSMLMQYGLLPPLQALPPAHQFIALPTIALSLTMGCGTWGGNSFSENLNYRHFMNVTRIVRTIPENKPSEEDLFGPFWTKYGK